jgi:hypothetical protein
MNINVLEMYKIKQDRYAKSFEITTECTEQCVWRSHYINFGSISKHFVQSIIKQRG